MLSAEINVILGYLCERNHIGIILKIKQIKLDNSQNILNDTFSQYLPKILGISARLIIFLLFVFSARLNI